MPARKRKMPHRRRKTHRKGGALDLKKLASMAKKVNEVARDTKVISKSLKKFDQNQASEIANSLGYGSKGGSFFSNLAGSVISAPGNILRGTAEGLKNSVGLGRAPRRRLNRMVMY